MSDRIAVMDGGVVQQVDAPRALYERPATAFVADFIGTSNSLALTGARRSDGLVVMELGEGMRIVAPDTGDGADCQITVRPEKIRIGTESDGANGSRVSGTVVEQVYLGSLSQTVVEIVTGERLIVHELNDDDERPSPEPGESVVLELACPAQPRDRGRAGSVRARALRGAGRALRRAGRLRLGLGRDLGRPGAQGPRRAGDRNAALLRLRRHGHRRAPRPVPRAEPRRRPPDGELQLEQGRGGEARRRLRRRRGRDLRRRDGAAADPRADPAARPGGDRRLRRALAVELRRDPQRGGQGALRPHLGRAARPGRQLRRGRRRPRSTPTRISSTRLTPGARRWSRRR